MRATVRVSLKVRPSWILTFVAALTAALLSASAAASQDGSGVIVEANPSSTFDLGPLNPLLCYSEYCQRIVEFLFPTLFAYDPANGALVGAADDNRALVVEPSLQAGEVQTLKLRDDLAWSDGAPVTAYDVFYSYLAAASSLIDSPYRPVARQISGAQVSDEHTIALQYAAPDCSSFARSNLPIVPAHVFDAEFASFVDTMNAAQSDAIQPLETWLEAYPETKFSDPGQRFQPEPDLRQRHIRFRHAARHLTFDSWRTTRPLSTWTYPAVRFSRIFPVPGARLTLFNPVCERRDETARASP
jgi:ABC-type transport system substrate-binding protein